MGFKASSGRDGHHLPLAPIYLLKDWLLRCVWQGFHNSWQQRPGPQTDLSCGMRRPQWCADMLYWNECYISTVQNSQGEFRMAMRGFEIGKALLWSVRFCTDSYFIPTSFYFFKVFTWWKCIHEQSLRKKIWSESGKDKKKYCQTAQTLSFDPISTTGLGRIMSSQWQKMGHNWRIKCFHLEGRTKVFKILGCITALPTRDVIRNVEHQNENNNVPLLGY